MFLQSKFIQIKQFISSIVILIFVLTSIIPPQRVYAQNILNLPPVGAMIKPTDSYNPVIMAGMTIIPENPLQFNFIIDSGDDNLQGEAFEQEAMKLIKYFLASLTIPEDEMWVNLSPYEKDRIIPQSFGKTEMGRDLLAQDYMLKQLMSSLMNPKEGLGAEFWGRVYAKAEHQFGTVDIPMNTYNKIWILPEDAVVYEHQRGAFIVRKHLKVMLEEDYLALESNRNSTKHGLGDVTHEELDVISGVSAEIVREILLPEIEKEVNHGETFANLRQIYNSMILATWYKGALKDSFLGAVYIDKNKTAGVELEDEEVNQKIWEQYVESFKKGVFDFIEEDYDPVKQETISRRYFSGGAVGPTREDLAMLNNATPNPTALEEARLKALEMKGGRVVSVQLASPAGTAPKMGVETVRIPGGDATAQAVVSSPSAKRISDDLYAVHATKYLPIHGTIRAVGDVADTGWQGLDAPPAFRLTIHWALGQMIQSGRWKESPYAVITPVESLESQLVNIHPLDTMIMGDFQLTEKSVLVVPKGTDISAIPASIEVVEYDSDITLSQACDKVIAEKKGLPFELPALLSNHGIVRFEGKIVTKDFFDDYLKNHPRVSFGTHTLPQSGDAFRLGLVDHITQELIKGYSSQFSSTYNKKEIMLYRAVIEHHFQYLDKRLLSQDFPEHVKKRIMVEKENLRSWLNLVDADLYVRKKYLRTLIDMPENVWEEVVRRRYNLADLIKYLKKVHRKLHWSLPFIEWGGERYDRNRFTYLYSFISPDELEEFRASNPNLLGDKELRLIQTQYAIQRWVAIGSDQARAEGLPSLITDTKQITIDLIFDVLEGALNNNVSNLQTALDILQYSVVRDNLEKQGVIFPQDGPKTIEDVLRAHPRTKKIFEEPVEFLGDQDLEVYGFIEKVLSVDGKDELDNLNDQFDSFSSGISKVAAVEYKKERKIIWSEQMRLPINTNFEPRPGLMPLYKFMRRDYKEDPFEMFKKAGLSSWENAFNAMFPTAEDFWQSKQSLVDVYYALKEKQKVGGIDLNPNNLNLQVDKSENGFQAPMPQRFQNVDVDGFIPVIIQIVPVTNLPLISGNLIQDDVAQSSSI